MTGKIYGGVAAGASSLSLNCVLRKTSDSTEQTGKVAADMTLSYWRQGSTRTAVTASDLAAVSSAYSSGGVKEADATNMPGAYRIDWPDAAFAAGADWVEVTVKVASCFIYFERVPIYTPDALLDAANGIESGFTIRQAMRLMLAVLCGKASGLDTTTAVYRDVNDSKNRVSATVSVEGNRSAVTLDPS